MAFWGVHVKPEEPYTLKPGGGCLRISQATLADQCETPVPRSILECVVGNRPPISICSLSLKEIHSCQLDLQFEELEDVIFSVSGSRGVHLCGYYLAPSPTVIMGTASTGLDDFTIGFHNRNEANFLRKEAEIEKEKKMIFSEEDIGDTDSFGDGSDEENVYDLNDSFIDDSNAFDFSDSSIDDDAAKPLVQPEHPKVGEHHACGVGKMAVRKRGSGRAVHKRESGATFVWGLMDKHDDVMINGELESKLHAENSSCPKRKGKFSSEDIRSIDGLYQDIAHKCETKNNSMHKSSINGDLHLQRSILCGTYDMTSKKKKNKNRKIRTEENEENMMSKRKKSVTKFEDKHLNSQSSQATTSLDGIIIEDLAMGDPRGKIAAPRSKVKILYTAWLKETGEFIECSESPIKFCLGDEKIIKGWNIGIEGMCAGDKRRLILSPSMGSWGITETHPLSNSWLVYDVELVSVS